MRLKFIKCRGNGLTAIAVRKKKKKKKNALTILANRDSTMYLDIYLESVPESMYALVIVEERK